MKVLFCAYDRPGHLATGPNAWIQRLVPDLIESYGLRVHTLFIYEDREIECPTLSFFKNRGLPTSTINRQAVPYIADQVKALLKIVKHENISVVVANLVIPAFYAASYLKRSHIPVIGVMHSNDSFYKSVIEKFIHGPIPNQLSHSIAVSNYINTLSQIKPTSSDLQVIPCGTPMPEAKATWSSQRVLKVMYAGRIVEEQKQILKLTTAFIDAAVNDGRLKFSIFGDGAQVEQVKKLLNTQPINSVAYQGALVPADMFKYFEQHQVFTLMSDYEGMPIALMEAMACGLVPVCLQEVSGINEIIEHGVNGFIVKDRDADYQKHLKMLLDNPDLWQKLSNNAVKTIQQFYSSAQTHRQWYELLQSFSGQQIGSIKIPRHIKLEGDLLYYGDNRKPTKSAILQKKLMEQWMRLRLFLRPRARLRELINNQNK